MKKILSSIHLPIFIFGSIAIFIAGTIALFVILNPVLAQGMVDLIKKPFQSVDLRSSSSVELYQEGDTLKVKFKLIEQDKPQFLVLSEKLGVNNAWQEGIGMGLDEESMNSIRPYLPLKSDVHLNGNTIQLTGSSFNFMPSGGGGEEISFATDGGTLRYTGGQTTASVYMEKPSSLVSYATASGKLNLSRKIESELFSLSDKIATIDMHIKGKSVEGKIVLK